MARKKNAAAVALAARRMLKMTKEQRSDVGRQGGLVGGKARAESMTPKERSASASNAARARWNK